jgi:hypothetical protein
MKMLVGLWLLVVSVAVSATEVNGKFVTSQVSESDYAVILAVEIAVIAAVAFAIGAWIYLSRQKF